MEGVLRQFYIGDERIGEDTVWSVIDFISDYKFNYGTVRSIQKYIENGAENIFNYMFSYDGARNFVKDALNLTGSGAAHANEIGYLFDISYMKNKPTPEGQTVIDSITTLWSNFVKCGYPTPETSELLPVTWTPVSQNAWFYLDIDTDISIKQRPFHARMAFWELFYKLNEKGQKALTTMYLKYQFLAIASCILLQNLRAIPRIDPLVDTKLGLIRGLQSSNGQYSMFMGIPYATVEEGNPFGGFDKVFEAYDDSAICPQVEEFNNTIVGSLDCLHLNVYVPNTASSQERLPVLVWIYGGGFSIGFSGRHLYGPGYLVRHDIILVTLNYRLGPYGFMCLDNPAVPGNQGLKDQRIALKWVKDNIEAFGGDANKITIFGESAGASSVDLHLYYQEERLFEQVIMQSGSALSPWAVLEPDTSVPLALAE
ncbi:Uncharacterized protein OBRU01_10551 [Operophtera brumata]|uniref:Carboxylic ester hydrolase n=1 Tax=Operophtera brumata TaxID=104452 RepID=A0A0L7LDL1_OPEBR|nr:Uncharacterized protein OBRU01_10551 [Operophtera brumata]